MTQSAKLDLSSSPCTNCKYKRLCMSDHKACEKFFEFTKTGEINEHITPHPSHEWYDEVFAEGHLDSPIHIITTQDLLRLHRQSIDKSGIDFINAKTAHLYESSVDNSFDTDIFPMIGQWEQRWAITTGPPYVVVGAMMFSDLGDAYELNFLYIREAYKGRGIGTQLINELDTIAPRVIVHPEYESREFYEKHGYRPAAGTENLVYTKEIQPQLWKSDDTGLYSTDDGPEALPVHEGKYPGTLSGILRVEEKEEPEKQGDKTVR